MLKETPHPAAHGRHPLPSERAVILGRARTRIFSLSLGERVAEGRGRVRGLLSVPAPLRGQHRKAPDFAGGYLLPHGPRQPKPARPPHGTTSKETWLEKGCQEKGCQER